MGDTSASAPNLTTSTTATANNSGQNVAQKIRFFSIQRTASYKDTPSSRLSNIQVKAYKPPGERASSGGASGRRGNNKNKANNARPSEPKKSKLWYETYACGDMTREDIKRQESIHELCQGETEMLSDLTLAKQIRFMQNFRELYIENNHLTSLPSSIRNFTQLQVLDCSNNRLTSLPKTLFELKRLKKLRLSFNDLNVLDSRIDELGKLEELRWRGIT